MRKLFRIAVLACGFAGVVAASDLQGVVVDWNCVKPMVRNGREKTLKQNGSCSMMKNYNRDAYGLITIDKKFYRLEDPGNSKIKQLLKNTPDKDNLNVVVTGDIQGGTIKVINISML